MPEQKSALNIVMGAMTIGEPGTRGARVTDVQEIEQIFDVFQAHGHSKVDTAFWYCSLSSEKILGKTTWKERGIKMDTKLFPSTIFPLPPTAPKVTHSPEDLRKYIDIQLKNLNTDTLETFYLHGPDRTTPYEDTLRTINELHKEGKFKQFGISNYMSWEIAEIVCICRQNGWIQPTAFEGPYNPINRIVEPEVFPCLRKFGISFYAFNPLAGGFFTGKYTNVDDKPEGVAGYVDKYWKEPNFRALALLRPICESHNLTLPEVALRWLSHHSLMKHEHGDSVLMGASSLKHVEQNLEYFEKGPLPEDVVKALDEAWEITKPSAGKYWY